MRTPKSFISVALAAILVAAGSVCPMVRAAENAEVKPEERAVTYKTIGNGDYQNFLKNWDEKRHVVLYALIQTPAQYDALFHPAPLMGDKRPFAPAAEIYGKEQIIVVARVIAAPENMDTVFTVERVVERDRALELHYRFDEPLRNAPFSVKNCLSVRIPKRDYQKVRFFENGKLIGELKPAEGQWAVPAMTPKPNKPDAGHGL